MGHLPFGGRKHGPAGLAVTVVSPGTGVHRTLDSLWGMRIIEGAGAWTAPEAGAANDWVENLRVPDLSVGTYCIPAGGTDDQSPHTEDEIYVVASGRATIVTPGGRAEVGPGAVIFVPAHEEHRFVDVTEDLALLVVFGPAYGARKED
jgi:mannose-6-phosphate isomerase-like protein (cupin superfamily)